jgi:hypothetical protein
MATQAPPPIVRHLIWGKAPQAKAAAAPHMSMPKVNAGLLQRGESAAGAGGAGGGGGHHAGGGAGNNIADAGFQDPVVSGMGYEQNPPQHGILGLLNNGKQSAAGNQQEALHGRFQQMSQLYNSVLDQGGTRQQAMIAVHRADPSFLMDVLVTHPGALKAFQTAADLNDFIAGKTPAEIPGEIVKGQQIFRNPTTGVARAEDVPGMDKPPAKVEKPQVIQTANGPQILQSDGTTKPILDQGGQPVQGKTTAANAPPGTVPSDIPNMPPQLSQNNKPKGGEDRIATSFLAATPSVIEAMQGIYNKASQMGVLKGFVTTKSGEFLGVNGQGGMIQAQLDAIKAAAPEMGPAYKASIDSFMGAMANPSQAPSFIRTQLPIMIDQLRDRAQGAAENVSQVRNAPLPLPIANRLIDVGVVPNGYQTQATMDRMNAKDPGSAARWKMQAAPQTLTSADKVQFYSDMTNGKYGPHPATVDQKGNPIPPDQWVVSPDFKRGYGMGLQDENAEKAKAAGAAASATAAAAQPQRGSGVPAQGTPAVPQVPDEKPQDQATQPAPTASAAPPNDAETSNQAVSGAGAGRSPATQTPAPVPAAEPALPPSESQEGKVIPLAPAPKPETQPQSPYAPDPATQP